MFRTDGAADPRALRARRRDDHEPRRGADRPDRRAAAGAADHDVRRSPQPDDSLLFGLDCGRCRTARCACGSTARSRATASIPTTRRSCGRRWATRDGCAATSQDGTGGFNQSGDVDGPRPRLARRRRAARAARRAGCGAGSSPTATRTSRRTRASPLLRAVDGGDRRRHHERGARRGRARGDRRPVRGRRRPALPAAERARSSRPSTPSLLEVERPATAGRRGPRSTTSPRAGPTTATGTSTPTPARSCSAPSCGRRTGRSAASAPSRRRARTSASAATASAAGSRGNIAAGEIGHAHDRHPLRRPGREPAARRRGASTPRRSTRPRCAARSCSAPATGPSPPTTTSTWPARPAPRWPGCGACPSTTTAGPSTTPRRGGGVRVLLVPAVAADAEGRVQFEQLVLSDELMEQVRRHLDERRMIGARVQLSPPRYLGRHGGDPGAGPAQGRRRRAAATPRCRRCPATSTR